MEMKAVEGGVCAAKGFRAAGIASGIKANGKPDMALILCEKDCAAAAVFTRNKVQAAPVQLTKSNVENGFIRGILANSGNANACTANGSQVAKRCCALLAERLDAHETDFAIASTGVIGQELPIKPFETGIPKLLSEISENGSDAAARAIMTTDTVKKEFAAEFELDGRVCHVGAIGKGSGMININMATMLLFITTDVAISTDMLHRALKEEMDVSVNQVCVDGDMSTNDTAVLLASGLAGNPEIKEDGEVYDAFCYALHDICVRMSRALAADGEGATKLVECAVKGAPTDEIARAVAKSVIASNLFKAAMFGEDANWGRALCAIGYAPGDFRVDNISVTLKSNSGEVMVCKKSEHHEYSEEKASEVLAEKEIQVLIDLGYGTATGKAWGCDLTYDYVKINGDYRS